MKDSFNWREFLSKVLAGCLILGSMILLILFVSMCFVYFPPRGYKSTVESLGLYGDFFGGILGTILSMASLGVTVYLAMVLHKIERENSETAIEAQRKVAIMQIKFQELALFKTKCDKDIESLSDIISNAKVEKGYRSIDRSIGRLLTLFPELANGNVGDRGIQFRIISYSAMMVSDQSRKLAEGPEQHFVGIDGEYDPEAIFRNAFKHLENLRAEYLEVIKKLSNWAAE